MPYTRLWDETNPPGTALAASLDTIIQNFKTDSRERVAGIFGLNLAEFTADPIVPKSLSLSVGYTGNMTGNVTGNVTGNLTGSILTAAQPNITSVGVLTNLDVSGKVSIGSPLSLVGFVAGDLLFAKNTSIRRANNAGTATQRVITFGGNDDVIYIAADGQAVLLSGTLGVTGLITGTLATAAQPNITSVGTQVAAVNSTAALVLVGTGQAASWQAMTLTNTSGQFFAGIDSSAGGVLSTGSSAYAAVLGTQVAKSLQLSTNNTVRQTIDSAGNVVFTGTVTAANFVGPTSIDANALTGTTLAAGVIHSSLKDLGVLTGLSVIAPATDGIHIGNTVSAAANLFLENTQGGAMRNWLATINYDSAAEFALRVSTATGGNPYSAGTSVFRLTSSGNLTLAGSIIAPVIGNLTGTVLTAAQGNITSLGILTGLNVNGVIVLDNGSSTYVGFNISAVGKAFYGISGGPGGIINGSVSGDGTIRTNGGNLLFSVDSGSTAGLQLKSTGQLLVGTTSITGVTAGGLGIAGFSRFDGQVKIKQIGQALVMDGATTGIVYSDTVNTSGYLRWGLEGSAGANLFAGATAYASVIGSNSATDFQLASNGVVRMTFASSGAVSALGAWTFNSTVGGITTLTATTLVGTLSTGLQTNITRVGTLDTTLSVNSAALVQSTNQGTGGAYAVFINTGGTYYIGVDNSTGAIFASGNYNFIIYTPFGLAVKISPTTNLATFSAGITLSGGVFTGNVTGNLTGNVTGTILTASQTNITALGTLTSLAVSGLSTFGTGHISQGASTSVGAVTTIYTVPSNSGGIVLVYGSDGTNIFIDEVLVGDTAASVALAHQFTIAGAPATRTYSMSSGLLRLAMGSGTYTIKTMPFYVN